MKIGVVGAAGRMGRMLIRQIIETEGCALAGAIERPESPAHGQDAGVLAGIAPLGIEVRADARALFEASDVVIDFTGPAATAGFAKLALETRTAMVIGTTGLGVAEQQAVDAAAAVAPIVQAPNMSVGVVLLTALVGQVATALDDDWDIEILEMHHRTKVDAPSGTALGLGAAAATARGKDLANDAVTVRDGHTGPRKRGSIGFASLRGGDVVGDHTVVFAGAGERIELVHKAASRQIYASGAIRAALWCRGRAPGRYGMRDVLGI